MIKLKNDKQQAERPVVLPCTKPDDLFAGPARQTISRLMGEWLRRHKMTVTELLHSSEALRKLESAGTTYQHAIQKMAVTMAGKTKAPVVGIVKALDTLTTAALHRVHTDERKGLFPESDSEGLVELAESFESDPNGQYIVSGVLAKHLSDCTSWDEKLQRVIRLHAQAAKAEHGAVLLARVTETLAAELVADESILAELLGPEKAFASRLFDAIRLFKGERSEDDSISDGLRLLTRYFADDNFSEARRVIAAHILAECSSTRRLRPKSLKEELEAFRRLVDELRPVEGPYFHRDDLTTAFSDRSKRFTTQEALGQLIGQANSADERLERLLNLESKLEGAANKRALTPFVAAILSGQKIEQEISPDYKGLPLLRRLAELQKRILASGLQVAERDKMAGALDAAAARVEGQGRFIAGIDSRLADPGERADAYLRLLAGGVFTEGRVSSKARRALLDTLASPGFAASYTSNKGGDRQTVLMALVEDLHKLGISPEEAVRAMTPA